MSNATSSVTGCFPAADEAFGPIIQPNAPNCRSFDFTIAFEQYFFSIAPAAILIVAASVRLHYLRNLPSLVAGNIFRLAKVSAVAVFAVFQLSLVAVWATQPTSLGHVRTVSLTASCLSLVASFLVCILSFTEHSKSLRPSFILNAYLFVSLLLDTAIVRSYWLSSLPFTLCALFTTSVALKAALLLLEAVEKGSFLKRQIALGNNPEITSGLYNRSLIWWMSPLIKHGFRHILLPDDLYTLDESMSAAVLHETFWQAWDSVNPNAKYRLIISCLKALRWPLVGAVVPRLFLLAFTVCQPLVLGRFLTFLQEPDESLKIGYGLIGAYILIYFGIAVSSALYEHQNSRTMTMLRSTLIAALFSRMTDLSTTEIDDSASVTLMSTDVDAIMRGWRELHELWANIIQICLAIWLLSIQIGFACIGPVIICGIALTASLFSGPHSMKFMMIWISKVQQRIGITSTMLGHMKSIKMSGLSQKLGANIAQLRKSEINAAAPFRMISAVVSATAQIPVLLSPVAAFAFFTIRSRDSGLSLDTTRMFTSLSLIILLGQPLFWMLEAVLDLSAALGCFKRIQNFLSKSSRGQGGVVVSHEAGFPKSNDARADGPDVQLTSRAKDMELSQVDHGSGRTGVTIRDAAFSWSTDSPPILRNLSMVIQDGQLSMIVGPVASGKTTLLKGLLGELPSISGHVKCGHKRVAYCEQSPWLFNDTILKNIIAYADYDENLYRSVTFACDLEKDFASLENGEQTIVGSKGIALSGGQKSRVALARAIYTRPQLALFDDPFSSLDNHTMQVVFDRIFKQQTGLLRQWGTTVVLVTRTVHLLPNADNIISLKDGSIAEQGTYSLLASAGGYIESLSRGISASKQQEQIKVVLEVEQNGNEKLRRKITTKSHAESGDRRRQRGDSLVYSYFFSSLGIYHLTGLLVCEVLWVFLSTFPTVWLSWWSESNSEEPYQRIGFYLGIYALLQILAVFAFGTMMLWVSVLTMSRCIKLITQDWDVFHRFSNRDQVSSEVVRRCNKGTSVTFHKHRRGINHNKDLGLLDRSLPLALLVSIANLFTVISQAGLLASSTGYVAITFPFLIALFYYIQRGYLRTSRQLRLLDLEQKAPVYSQFLETLSGLVTIRAFSWTAQAVIRNHSLIDISQRPYYLLLMIQQWLTLVLNLITAVLAIIIVCLAVKFRESVSAGLTGVSLIQLITLAETLKLLIQFWTSLETSLGAVARIKSFSEQTPDERQPGEDQQPPENWPAHGIIEISKVSASYGELLENNALNHIDLRIKAGQKVGLVGRTGSGKSTLLLTLLRLLANTSGTIKIDGVDISTLSRDVLRGRIITVSQDTFFLPGSIKENIDPYETANADEIEVVLRGLGLWDIITEKGGLKAKFSDGIFSHGQQQLFSLARAVLRKDSSRIVIFDEATSSVDSHTDAVIRQVINDEFQHHTIIWVAHRLESVLEFERVVMLENGSLVEDGNPKELIAASQTKFSKLWKVSHH